MNVSIFYLTNKKKRKNRHINTCPNEQNTCAYYFVAKGIAVVGFGWFTCVFGARNVTDGMMFTSIISFHFSTPKIYQPPTFFFFFYVPVVIRCHIPPETTSKMERQIKR